jgi:O-antigen/teichoic acid export membrane protein
MAHSVGTCTPADPVYTGNGSTRPMGELSDLQVRGIRGGVWSTGNAVASAALAFLNFAVLSRILGPESFGLMAMIDASLVLGQTLLATSFAESLVQIPRLRSEHKDTLFWTLQGLSGGLVLAAILLRGVVERFFVQEGLAQLLAATSLVLYLSATAAVPRALLVRELRFGATTQAAIVSGLVGGAIGLCLALTGQGVWSLVFLQLATAAVEMLILWWKSGWRPRARWSLSHFDELWRFSASRGLVNVLGYVDSHVPRIILGRVAGAAELGLFVFARRLLETAGDTLLRPIKDVAMPTFAEAQSDMKEARRVYCGGSRLTATVVFPAFAGIALMAPMLVPLVLGRRWIGAVPLIQLFALNACRKSFNVWNSSLLRGLGKPQWLLVGSGVRTLVTTALIFLLLRYSSIGVCLAMIIGNFVSWPLSMWYAARLTGLGQFVQIRQEAPAFGATLIMIAALLAIRRPIETYLPPWPAAATFAASGVGVYLASLAWLGRGDLVSLFNLLKKIRVVFRSGAAGVLDEEDERVVAPAE